ncbi:terpene synthase family protein [Chitinophaga flava]|uniref:Terpene synthase n=1 Tax=Chitinophaga flava TaxID=2259036 RepID=A0A365XVJ7_9BACT|nr:hypothetical protein [Chitinophaga flava]RBL90397.1 hypothetical protein DF182_28455 [Chitinophaga flava]
MKKSPLGGIKLPSLSYPFPDLKSTYAGRVETLAKQWLLNDYVNMPDEFKKKSEKYKYWDTNVGHMAARMYPYASFHRLIPISRFLLWGLSNDDMYEDASISELQCIRERAVSILRGHAVRENENELFNQLRLQREEMLEFMPLYWMTRYTNSISAGFEGMQLEYYYKAKMIFPGVDDYLAIREKAVLVFPLIDLIEIQSGHALPDKIFYHPDIQRIASLTCRIVAIANDYFSTWKERGKDVMNLILVLEHQEGLTTTDAYLRAIKIHDDYVTEFCDLSNNLPDFGIYQKTVTKFIDQLGTLISGHYSWYVNDTKRYLV